jgi:hypothetical protein
MGAVESSNNNSIETMGLEKHYKFKEAFHLLKVIWKDLWSTKHVHFLKSVRSVFADVITLLGKTFHPQNISLKYRVLFICAAFAIVGVYLLYDAQSRSNIKQARLAAWNSLSLGNKQPVFYDSPFFFPFKRPGNMIVPTPFSRDFLYGGEYNSSGFQTPEYTIVRPPNTFRILILGDSIAWSRGVPVKEAFPYRLQQNLNKECDTSGFEVISLAVPTYRLREALLTLLAHGESLKPDLILIQLRSRQFQLDIKKDGTVFHVNNSQQSEKSLKNSDEIPENLEEIKKWSDESGVPAVLLAQDDLLDHIPNVRFASLRLSAVSGNSANWDATIQANVANHVQQFLFQENIVTCSIPAAEASPLWEKENALRVSAAREWARIKDDDSKRLSFYNALHQLLPGDVWVTNHLAQAQYAAGKKKEAFSTYQSLSDLAPGLAAPWFQMSLCVSDAVQKTQLLERTVQLLPDHLHATRTLAENYIAEKRLKEGCGLLKRLTEIPQFPMQLERARKVFAQNDCNDFLDR